MNYATPQITASGTTFGQLVAAGLSAHLDRLIAAQAATLAPTVAPTASATGGGSTGGSLAAGTYYIKITELNGFGETTASPESAQLTVAAGNIPTVTFPTLKTGNVARNVYLTPVNGATGTEVYYAGGITAGTYNLSAAAPASTVAPPTSNTTGISSRQINRLHSARQGRLEDYYVKAAQVINNFCSGRPVDLPGMFGQVQDTSVLFHMLATAFDEIGVLLGANPGTLHSVTDAYSGNSSTKRKFP